MRGTTARVLILIVFAAFDSVSAEDDGATHWAYRVPVRAPLPAVARQLRVRTPIDRFVLARLEAEAIAPAAEATRSTLIRRLSLDLRGLPPTLAETESFVSDDSPDAFERLADRFLASVHYGERWGRHWLDIARYADSNGYTRDFGRSIWKYRDWVIDALNLDLPFDQFTIDQFAGDLLPEATLDQRIATGFHRNTLFNGEGGTDREQFRVEAIADRVATTGVAYLGLTLGCARCHDHKFDAISQREYFQLFAFLNNCDEPELDAPSEVQQEQDAIGQRAAIRAEIARIEKSLKAKQAEFDQSQLAWEKKAVGPELIKKLRVEVQEALFAKPEKRTDAQKKLAADLFKKTEDARRQFPAVAEIQRLQESEPVIPTTLVLARRKEPRETHIHVRGNFLDEGERVHAAVPLTLHPLPVGTEKPDRLDFARWLVDPTNPLTARVTVNRYWQRLFGRGIVETENDFGVQGTPPSHPALLDWLALEFIHGGWSTKGILRRIVTSGTYRQASHERADLAEKDPKNLLLSRQFRLRLEAELVRDVGLAVSGVLCEEIGGPGVHPPQPEGIFLFTQDPKPWVAETGANRFRRGMYTRLWRSLLYPGLVVFDFPEANVTCTRRVRSNTPLQALTLANDVVFVEFARHFAARVLSDGATDDQARISRMVRIGLSRDPSAAEATVLSNLLAGQRRAFAEDRAAAKELVSNEAIGDEDVAERAAWVAVARVLMNTDEFITRE